ncbi:hypothetical protein X777_01794 [Ooceraea biroi]|uniref:Uncharacterized protein n=1 Tax=Ooceraea biroi TaxID=2015173 RepID=A0A026WMP4_OOCBI|nr:hypothetical protein X777_01794 [Ooceraea biroi]
MIGVVVKESYIDRVLIVARLSACITRDHDREDSRKEAFSRSNIEDVIARSKPTSIQNRM